MKHIQTHATNWIWRGSSGGCFKTTQLARLLLNKKKCLFMPILCINIQQLSILVIPKCTVSTISAQLSVRLVYLKQAASDRQPSLREGVCGSQWKHSFHATDTYCFSGIKIKPLQHHFGYWLDMAWTLRVGLSGFNRLQALTDINSVPPGSSANVYDDWWGSQESHISKHTSTPVCYWPVSQTWNSLLLNVCSVLWEHYSKCAGIASPIKFTGDDLFHHYFENIVNKW